MTKERGKNAYQQQINFLNERLLEAIRNFKADETQEVFVYRHRGFLFSQTVKHFEKAGLILKWIKPTKEKPNGEWLFILPELFQIDLSNLRR